jgi:hypothetical protein
MGTDRALSALLLAWAIVDLVQLPLAAAVFVSFRLSRRLGAAWKAVAIAFAGYAAWVVVTARFAPYSASGMAVLLFGMLLDPRRGTPPERVWALGSAVAAVLFFGVPVAAAWALRGVRLRRGGDARGGGGR